MSYKPNNSKRKLHVRSLTNKVSIRKVKKVNVKIASEELQLDHFVLIIQCFTLTKLVPIFPATRLNVVKLSHRELNAIYIKNWIL